MTALDRSIEEAEAMAAYLNSKGQPEYVRMRLWARFLEIHKRRPPEQVAAMEKELGL